jgi:hypothetical protein
MQMVDGKGEELEVLGRVGLALQELNAEDRGFEGE